MLRAFGLVDLDEAKWDTLFTELLSKIGNAIPNKILNTPPRNSMKGTSNNPRFSVNPTAQ